MSIKKIFIANRGEIAVRIIKAAKGLNIETVQAYSDGDKEMMAVKLADHSVNVGPAKAADSYLNINKMVNAAIISGADAVHPGYGFLAESADFVRAVEDAGLIFIGPSAEVIDRMGDKVAARSAALAANVPVVPGSKGLITNNDEAIEVANEIGYPVMIKATAGGGGRGIRVADNQEELIKYTSQARAEAEAAFGDGGLYIEKAIKNPRHIEVQILADGTDAIHCFERECSVQRRRQKVWEEAGADCLDEATRDKLCAGAVELAKAVGYKGAGTLEYLYDEKSNSFYFIEMNTRIQVEHTISEMITGIDLVQEMIKIAGGAKLSYKQADIRRDGHAIEVRINAENPFMQFLPFPGKVVSLQIPTGEGIRFDHFIYEGYQISPFYDSLIGKLIVHAPDRAAAIDKMSEALQGLEIGGLKTTIPLHKALAKDAAIKAGDIHTQWLEPWLDAGNLKEEKAS
ncbi:MAG: acetyl-CoA carboxylase biotin carboxylase subunit [Rhizobiales bacterium]|nr:acetyl-CoA carboxylase biotin carboxylase subunit [Hyphomicrobiales bacterium]